MAPKTFVSFILLLGLSFLVAAQAIALETVTVQGGGMARDVYLGMSKKDIITAIGAPSRIKSEGYCLQYDTFDMSLYLNRDMRVERIYLGRNFKGNIGAKSSQEASMSDVYRDYGSPRTTERLTYTPSPSLQTSTTVELENKVTPRAAAKAATYPMEYRGDRTLYELHSHDMVMKYKYVLDNEGFAFWMDDLESVYATVLYPPRGEARARLYLEPVYFDFDKYNLKQEYVGVLNRDSELIKQREDLLVTVAGHTDSNGTVPYNQTLSERRSKTVFDYLAEKGVPPSQLRTVGYSKLRPVADNKTKEGRAKNRRVELETSEILEDPGPQR